MSKSPPQLEEQREAVRAELEQAYACLKALREQVAEHGVTSPQASFMAAVEAQLKSTEEVLAALETHE